MPPLSSSPMRRPLLHRLAHRPQPPLARTLCLVLQHAPPPRRSPAFPPVAPPRTKTATTATMKMMTMTATHRLLSRRLSSSPRPRQEQEPHRYYFASPPPPSPPPAAPSPPPRRLRPWISAAVFLWIGAVFGTLVRNVLVPPARPEPGSPEDLASREYIRKQAMKLPIVQKLMGDPEWTHHEAYTSISDALRPGRITTGPLSGATCIGAYQHIFHHHPPGSPSPDPPEVVDVIYFGPDTSGWPFVVHGGLIATILDEHSARAAVADPALRARDLGVLTARLDVQYRRPTYADGFYVARARALRDDELEPRERGKRDRKVWVDVVLETTGGRECVRARALFVIPKGTQLRGIAEGF